MNNRIFQYSGETAGKSLVYYTQPGVEAENYGMQMIYDSLRKGRTCVFVASNIAPSVIKDEFREIGLDIDPYKGKLIFVDAYNPLIMAPSREKYVISNPDNISEFSKIIIKLMDELPPSTILFNSLSTIMDLCGEEVTVEAVRGWNKAAKLYGHEIVYNFTAWPYSRQTLATIQKELFNSVISIDKFPGNFLSGLMSRFLRSECN